MSEIRYTVSMGEYHKALAHPLFEVEWDGEFVTIRVDSIEAEFSVRATRDETGALRVGDGAAFFVAYLGGNLDAILKLARTAGP